MPGLLVHFRRAPLLNRWLPFKIIFWERVAFEASTVLVTLSRTRSNFGTKYFLENCSAREQSCFFFCKAGREVCRRTFKKIGVLAREGSATAFVLVVWRSMRLVNSGTAFLSLILHHQILGCPSHPLRPVLRSRYLRLHPMLKSASLPMLRPSAGATTLTLRRVTAKSL
jgi:hypothetical protein